jgi:GT2 family glycosyltransferase
METDRPLVHVIVLNYNGKSHLEYCLPSIQSTDYSNYRIVVVDNNSTDGSIEYVEENFPSIKLIQLNENLGWAGGNNVGVMYARECDAEYVVFANNDIRVQNNWISGAVEAAESDCEVGFVGFNIFGTVQPVHVDKYEAACKDYEGISYEYTKEFIDGMALFARLSVFDNIGPIDEDFFLYAEETDLEIRGKKAGYRRMRTNAPVWHYSSGTMEEVPIKASYLAIRNHIRLALKHKSPRGVIRRLGLLYYTGCSPFFTGDMQNRINARRRPRGIIFNFLLITYCLFWNIVHFPETFTVRRRDYRRIDEYRKVKKDN